MKPFKPLLLVCGLLLLPVATPPAAFAATPSSATVPAGKSAGKSVQKQRQAKARKVGKKKMAPGKITGTVKPHTTAQGRQSAAKKASGKRLAARQVRPRAARPHAQVAPAVVAPLRVAGGVGAHQATAPPTTAAVTLVSTATAAGRDAASKRRLHELLRAEEATLRRELAVRGGPDASPL